MDWKQISGDVTASEHGAVFAQDDYSFSAVRLYGVRVFEIINMLDACGGDVEDYPGGIYTTSSSYVDVDSLPWEKAHSILQSCGWTSRKAGECELPEEVEERLAAIKCEAGDLRKLARWENRALSEAETIKLSLLGDEENTLVTWFGMPPEDRAEAAHSYGGFTDGQSTSFQTLEMAMDSEGIPASALWRPSEYKAVPSDIEVPEYGFVVNLTYESGIGRRYYHDDEGNEWEEYDMGGYLDQWDDGESKCVSCHTPLDSHVFYPVEDSDSAYCPGCVRTY